jgi:uncharacterized protein YrrD
MFMQFKEGAKVYSADDERVGTVDGVVLEPDTKEVTDLLVQKGFLFKEDRVVPVSLVGPATEERVTLRQDADELENLPVFEETQYVEADADAASGVRSVGWVRPLYWYPGIGAWWPAGGVAAYAKPPFVADTEKNIPEGTVSLKAGAKVIGSDGEEVGEVEEVFTEALEDRATHLLISEGLLLKEKKLVPTRWVNHVLGSEVHLSVGSAFVEGLPEYGLED